MKTSKELAKELYQKQTETCAREAFEEGKTLRKELSTLKTQMAKI